MCVPPYKDVPLAMCAVYNTRHTKPCPRCKQCVCLFLLRSISYILYITQHDITPTLWIMNSDQKWIWNVEENKLDQILGLNRSARLNEDIGLWSIWHFDLWGKEWRRKGRKYLEKENICLLRRNFAYFACSAYSG